MSKMDALWAYQAAEQNKEALEKEVLATPARAKFNKLHAFLKEQQNTISRVQEDIAGREAQIDRLEEAIVKLSKDIELERSEFETMLADEECTAAELTECRQIHEKLLREIGDARKTLTALMSALEEDVAQYRSTRSKASKAKKEYDELRVVCESEIAKSAPERKQAQAAMDEAAKKVDAQLLERYKRVKRNHAIPMAKVENNQCGGCNMSLPMVVVKRVAASDNIIECENCGRILYTGS